MLRSFEDPLFLADSCGKIGLREKNRLFRLVRFDRPVACCKLRLIPLAYSCGRFTDVVSGGVACLLLAVWWPHWFIYLSGGLIVSQSVRASERAELVGQQRSPHRPSEADLSATLLTPIYRRWLVQQRSPNRPIDADWSATFPASIERGN